MANPSVDFPDSTSHDLIRQARIGVVTETYDARTSCSAQTLVNTGGMIRAGLAPILAGDLITSLCIYMGGTVGTVTTFQLVVYDEQFNLIGNTADLSGSLVQNNWIVAPLVTPLKFTKNTIIYLGAFVNASVAPNAVCSNIGSSGFAVVPNTGRSMFNIWSQTVGALPQIATPTTGAFLPYIAAL